MSELPANPYPAFDREALARAGTFQVLGPGEIGGKGRGLAAVATGLAEEFPAGADGGPVVRIPTVAALATGVFEQFMEANDLWELALEETSDERIGNAFQRAALPALVVGDLRSLAAQLHAPLAIRSSSLLEDALNHPLAGTYATKMIPNSAPDESARLRALSEAVKFVYASTFFADAKRYHAAIGQSSRRERMAVLVQEVVGQRHGNAYYPHLSGVIRTYNDYAMNSAPEEGVALLALGLGKTIVDGGLAWTYVPGAPQRPAPFAGTADMLRNTQTSFWAVNLGRPAVYNPLAEIEYLVDRDLAAAEYDGTLTHLVSTFDAAADRMRPGLGREGPRVLNFAPLLEFGELPFDATVARLAAFGKAALGQEVEMEFAATLGPDGGRPVEFGFLQIRPLRAAVEAVEVEEADLAAEGVLVATRSVLGHATSDELTDVIYVVPERFGAEHTPAIAAEVDALGRTLQEAGRSYVLIGFGRWGSSDPWLGIPVTWPQIAGARVIVEATRPDLDVEPSQGTHFFHNLRNFRVPYLTVRHGSAERIDFAHLAALPAVAETTFVRHVRLPTALRVRVDGRRRLGVVARRG